MAKSEHDGHSLRLKERFLKTGFDGFAEHEVLELVIFFAIPYRDTNELAHNLIKRYGSLAAVCEADYEDLLQVKGVGPNTACLLNMLPLFAAYYMQNRWQSTISLISQKHEFVDYVKALFVGQKCEQFYAIMLNSKQEIIIAEKLDTGTVGEVSVHLAKLVSAAVRHNARGVVLAHNHPGGLCKPSNSDLILTRQCIFALQAINVKVLDHYIICGADYLSFSDQGLINAAVQTPTEK